VHGDLKIPELRQVFSAGEGLVRTKLGWRRPSDVLVGEPVFGDYRAFAPYVPGSEALWSRLQLREPSVRDCGDVLGEIADKNEEPDVATQVVLIETLRLLSTQLGDAVKATPYRRRLGSVGIWTSQGWTTDRPVYAIEDPVLAAGLAGRVPVWRPGGELAQFQNLVAPLGLIEIDADDARVVGVESAGADEEATELLRAAVPLLREDLARNDPATERSLRLDWSNLETFEVRIVDELRVRVSGLVGGSSVLWASPRRADGWL
jgi:hypothetical protein